MLGGAEAREEGALAEASFLVDCRSGFATVGALSGDIVTPTAKTMGTHGYRNTHPEMHSSFFVIGGGIQPGKKLGTIDIRSIAPTLARELGTDMPEAERPVLPLR